jgi:hypothetical protein
LAELNAAPANATSPTDHATVSGGYLDAAGPLIQPRDLERYLPDLRAGEVTTVLATVASIEDSRYALGVLAHWLLLDTTPGTGSATAAWSGPTAGCPTSAARPSPG